MSTISNPRKNANPINKHYFLGEELLVPRANHTSTQRLNMFSSHTNQFVETKFAEPPRVFTGFENQIGEYSVAAVRAKEDFEIIRKIYKNNFNYVMIIRYVDSGIYDILEFNRAKHITEDYGYEMIEREPYMRQGQVINKGSLVYSSHAYDEDEDYGYGINLNAVYMAYKNLTYEDGIVISKSASERLTSFNVEETTFSINSNDVLLNIYGDQENYKSFPRIGDSVNNNTLVAIRRIDHSKMFYDFQSYKMREIDNLEDSIIYSDGGMIVDIDIYNNMELNKLKERNNKFTNELVELYEEQLNFYTELAEALEEIIPTERIPKAEFDKIRQYYGHVPKRPIPREQNINEYTNELAYWWKFSHEWIDEKIKWREDNKVFDSFRIKFTILREKPAEQGSKLTGRYGNKGVIVAILDDEQMPVNEYGERAEIILNSLGVINRLNFSQLFEQHLNFIGNNIVRNIKGKPLEEKEKIFFPVMKDLVPQQYEFLANEYDMMNLNRKKEFFLDLETEGIYFHQYPFYDNIEFEEFIEIMDRYPELHQPYHFEGIEKPMIMGETYIMRLKHESANKTSNRATSLSNLKKLPSKSTLKKEKRVHVSDTPIRVGDMETSNLLIANRGDLIEKYFKSQSTSEEDRINLVNQILTADNPMQLNVSITGTNSINRKILNNYLQVLEVELED